MVQAMCAGVSMSIARVLLEFKGVMVSVISADSFCSA